MINNKPVQVSIGSINFNPEAVKTNKIKNIDITVADKPDGLLIIDKGTAYGYQFNDKGYVTHYYYTVFNKMVMEEVVSQSKKEKNKPSSKTTNIFRKYANDSVFVTVLYDSLNRIICKRVKTDNIYDGYYFEYDNQNQIIKEMHFKETNTSEEKNNFKLGTQELISSETYEYTVLTPTQIKKKHINKAGHPYKTSVINFNDKKNIISEAREFTVSWLRQEYNYEYDSDNRLVKKIYKSNENGPVIEEFVYEYSKNGNLISEKKFKNNEMLFEIIYLYDENETLIKSEVNRDYRDCVILLIKYKYEFY